VADSRFRLVGVVAPRGTAASGLALISVDGKPPRAVAVGRELEPGLRLLAVSHRQAELGAAKGATALTLALPPVAEAQRGRPGEGAPPAAGVPGVPGALPPGLPMVNRGLLGVPPPGMKLPGGQPQQVPLPGMPVQPHAVPQESSDGNPTDNNVNSRS
jgi:general secretion pathway protein C